MSLSSGGSSTTEANAIQAALDAGVIIVAAAGNKGNSDPRYPAAYPGVIAVGATDLSGELAPYSNYGSHVSVVAPGGNTAIDLNDDGYVDGVLSCGWKQDTNEPGFPFYQGTSMASPHVAGVVSLMLAKNPNLTPAQRNSSSRTRPSISAIRVGTTGMAMGSSIRWPPLRRSAASPPSRSWLFPQIRWTSGTPRRRWLRPCLMAAAAR